MATESSAVVRFINTVQQSQAPSLPSLAPDVTMTTRHPRRRIEISIAVVAAILVVAGAIALGFFFAKRAGSEPASAPALAAKPAAAPQPAASPAPAAAPAPTETEAVVAIAKETGFDIRVEPSGALVSLDGKEIGRAPLRVRNLLPGEHQVGVAGPEGYFGQHMVVVLSPGVAQELTIELEPLDDGDLVASAIDDDAADDAEDAAEADEAAARAAAAEILRGSDDSARGDDDSARGDDDSARSERKARRRAKRRARRQARRDRSTKVAGATGRLMLGSKPPCDIYIDGRSTGLTTPQRDLELGEGTHTITLVNRQHDIKKRFKVRISAGKTTRAIQDLTSRL